MLYFKKKRITCILQYYFNHYSSHRKDNMFTAFEQQERQLEHLQDNCIEQGGIDIWNLIFRL